LARIKIEVKVKVKVKIEVEISQICFFTQSLAKQFTIPLFPSSSIKTFRRKMFQTNIIILIL